MTVCKQEPVIGNLISSKPNCNSKYYICLRDCIPIGNAIFRVSLKACLDKYKLNNNFLLLRPDIFNHCLAIKVTCTN